VTSAKRSSINFLLPSWSWSVSNRSTSWV